MSKHDPFADIREAAEKLGLPPREIARIVQIAQINQELERRREVEREANDLTGKLWGKPDPAPQPRVILSFSKADKPIKLVEPANATFSNPELWCDQCDRRVKRMEAVGCASQWCKAKEKL